jgi:TRAP-type mannitol/chloroaromatic compound transport system permease small subunit
VASNRQSATNGRSIRAPCAVRRVPAESSIENPVSSIQYRVSSIQYRATSIQKPASSERCHMSTLKAFLKFINAVNDWVGNLLSYFLFLFFALLFMEVILRYFFNSPTVWANELAQMLFGAYAILAGGYIMRTGGHVNVDIVYSRLSKKSKAGLDIFTSILFFLFCGMMLIYGGSLAWDSLSRFEHSQSAWNPPLYPAKLMIPLAALLLMLQGLAKLMRDICIFLDVDIDVAQETQKGETL